MPLQGAELRCCCHCCLRFGAWLLCRVLLSGCSCQSLRSLALEGATAGFCCRVLRSALLGAGAAQVLPTNIFCYRGLCWRIFFQRFESLETAG